MPSNWSMIDNSFPSFTGRERPSEQIAVLQNYMQMLVEQLKYQLNNLDSSNWNGTALKSMQKETTEGVEGEVEGVSAELAGVVADLERALQRLTGVETDISYLEQAQAEQEQRLTDTEEDVGDLQTGMTALLELIGFDEDGNAVIGKSGKSVRLVGDIYINGTLQEGGT